MHHLLILCSYFYANFSCLLLSSTKSYHLVCSSWRIWCSQGRSCVVSVSSVQKILGWSRRRRCFSPSSWHFTDSSRGLVYLSECSLRHLRGRLYEYWKLYTSMEVLWWVSWLILRNVVVKHVTILNPLVSPNTDGIDPGKSPGDEQEQEVMQWDR